MVAMGLLLFNLLMNQPPKPQVDPDPDEAAADKDGKKPDATDGDEDEPDKPATDPEKPVIDEGIRVERRMTIGSLDPESGYPMLVTLTSKGAAIERVELSNPRFRDIDDRTGYLGNLAPSNNEDELGAGCVVNVVGAGTPAQIAGLRVGDLITAVDNVAVGGKDPFLTEMSKTRPRQQITLSVVRKTKSAIEELSLDVPLVRRPLEVCRPEIENIASRGEKIEDLPKPIVDHPSLLMTFQEINKSNLGEDAGELPGLDMREGAWEVLESDSANEVKFRRRLADKQLEVIKHYRLEKAEDDLTYHLNFEITITNLAKDSQDVSYRLDGPTGLPTEGHWYASKIGPNWTGGAGLRDFVVGLRNSDGYITKANYQFISATSLAGGTKTTALEENKDRSLAFVGTDAQYFAAALLPGDGDDSGIRFAKIEPLLVGSFDPQHKNRANISSRVITTPLKIAPAESVSQSYRFFAGPKEPEVLANYQMQKLIVYGWFGWVVRPMTGLLHILNFVNNYGVAIIFLTVIVRLCMFPLSRKQVMGAQKMQQLQPEMKKLSEKYKEDRPTLAKKQQELFRKHNYNPLSGCLLLFVQLPIFIGLYRALSIDIALRDASFFGENVHWISNLAAPDMLLNWSDWMPRFFQSMLGPYLNLLPLFTVVLFLVQQKMFMPPPADDTAAMQQKVMTFMMIFIGFMFYRVASGLCLYFIVSSLWGIIERKVLPKTAAASEEPIVLTPDPPKVKAMANKGGGPKNKKKKKGRK